MNKTHTTYGVMVFVFALGLWAILRAGSRLHAARNVAGEWDMKWGQEGPGLADRMTLSQSGVFLNATLHEPDRGDGLRLRGRLEGDGSESGRKVVLYAVNSELTLAGTFDEGGQILVGSVQADTPAGWQATRVKPSSPAH